MVPTRRPWLPLTPVCLGVLYVVWGSTYLAQRVAVAAIPPLQMVAVRFLVAGAALFGLVWVRGERAPDRRAWGAALVSSLPLMVFGMGTAAIALQRVPSGLAALVFGSVPLWTALFDRLWGGRLRPVEGVGMALGFSGVALVASRGALGADPGGGLLLAVAAASYALGCVATRRAPLAPGLMGTASQMLCGGLLLAAASLLRGERFAWPPARATAALAYLVVFGSLVAYSAFGWLLKNVRPALATSYAYVNPILALVLGAALGGERFQSSDYAGLGLVLGAVGLVAHAQRRAPASPPQEETDLAQHGDVRRGEGALVQLVGPRPADIGHVEGSRLR